MGSPCFFFTLGAPYSECFHSKSFQNCLQCCCRWVSICYTSFLLYFPETSELKIHPRCIRFKILCICICFWIVLYSQFTFHNMLHVCAFQCKEWRLLYDSQEHGQSLNRCNFIICTFLKQLWGNLIVQSRACTRILLVYI